MFFSGRNFFEFLQQGNLRLFVCVWCLFLLCQLLFQIASFKFELIDEQGPFVGYFFPVFIP